MPNSAERVPTGRLWLLALAAAGIAAVVNLLIWLLAGMINIPLNVQMGGPEAPVVPLSAGPVIVMSVVPAIAGAALLWLLGRVTARPFRWFTIIAVVVLLLSLAGPLLLPVALANKLVLSLMHVVAAGVIVGILRK
ncbi:hypothetical protein SE17_30120 [Kouleothrix aurantiaca]|uniref:Uncharacterized protein n=1 Tax=Kouleothrix aurantiaca TaxID=186479 RepID=A0A0P9D3P6_9CHLR|nr:hypothetical protein SE17_30120 [Kouleothrix aurantiaca]